MDDCVQQQSKINPKKEEERWLDDIYNCRITLTPTTFAPFDLPMFNMILKKKQTYHFKVLHEDLLAIDVIYFWGNGPICYGLITIPCTIYLTLYKNLGTLDFSEKINVL